MKNHLKIILRNALKNKAISLLNILGLSIGFVCSIFLITWILHESSYDWFVKEKDKIFRVTMEGEIDGQYRRSASCVAGIGPESALLFPEVVTYTRIRDNYSNALIKTTQNEFFRAEGLSADSTFFNLFPFKTILGETEIALTKKNHVVIDQTLARKIFGSEYDALGQPLIRVS